jgi:hypothetical protein
LGLAFLIKSTFRNKWKLRAEEFRLICLDDDTGGLCSKQFNLQPPPQN